MASEQSVHSWARAVQGECCQLGGSGNRCTWDCAFRKLDTREEDDSGNQDLSCGPLRPQGLELELRTASILGKMGSLLPGWPRMLVYNYL